MTDLMMDSINPSGSIFCLEFSVSLCFFCQFLIKLMAAALGNSVESAGSCNVLLFQQLLLLVSSYTNTVIITLCACARGKAIGFVYHRSVVCCLRAQKFA